MSYSPRVALSSSCRGLDLSPTHLWNSWPCTLASSTTKYHPAVSTTLSARPALETMRVAHFALHLSVCAYVSVCFWAAHCQVCLSTCLLASYLKYMCTVGNVKELPIGLVQGVYNTGRNTTLIRTSTRSQLLRTAHKLLTAWAGRPPPYPDRLPPGSAATWVFCYLHPQRSQSFSNKPFTRFDMREQSDQFQANFIEG